MQFWVSQWKRECIWTAAIVAFQQNIDCYYGITGTQRAHAQNKREAPEDLDEDVCYDLMRSQRLGNVCVTQRVTNHFTADCFREKQITKAAVNTQSRMFKRQVPLGCRRRSATSPKSPNGRGLAFMWIMLFILGLSSYISVLQTSTPLQPFGILKYFTGLLCRFYYQGLCTSGKSACVCVSVCFKCCSAGVIEGLH